MNNKVLLNRSYTIYFFIFDKKKCHINNLKINCLKLSNKKLITYFLW